MKLVVSFETSDLGEREFFYDQLIIKSGDNFREEIDLYAYKPSPVIVFEPFINLGFVQIGESKVHKILFKNEGMLEDKITLKLEGLQDVIVDETYFSIPPKKSREITLTYTPREAGIFRGTIEVDCSGQSVLKTIDISATSVEYFIFMIDENGIQTTDADFGIMYFGQYKEKVFYLVNNAPVAQPFNTKFIIGGKKDMEESESKKEMLTPFKVGVEQTQRIMDCVPKEGVIPAYSKVISTFPKFLKNFLV